jgi:hypothetical protein
MQQKYGRNNLTKVILLVIFRAILDVNKYRVFNVLLNKTIYAPFKNNLLDKTPQVLTCLINLEELIIIYCKL